MHPPVCETETWRPRAPRAARRTRRDRGPRAAAPALSSTAIRASRCIRPGPDAERRLAAAVLAWWLPLFPNAVWFASKRSNAHATVRSAQLVHKWRPKFLEKNGSPRSRPLVGCRRPRLYHAKPVQPLTSVCTETGQETRAHLEIAVPIPESNNTPARGALALHTTTAEHTT